MSRSKESQASPVRVFISYSHDSREHCDQILAFAQQLRRDGIDAELDQFHQDELVYWPRWCEEQLSPENSKYVLCVCTAEYRRRVENKVPADVGKGVFWEATLIYNYLYDKKGNERCMPILIGGAQEDAIPQILRGWNRYQLTTFRLKNGDPGYEGLYRLLTGKPKVKPEPLGKPISLLEKGAPGAPEHALPPRLEIPERKTDFMRIIEVVQLPERNPFFTGREPVLARLQEALAARGRAALSGLGGVGKTQTAVEYAHRHLDDYVYTFWATAHSREALVSGYLAVAGLLKLTESDAKDQTLAVDAVKRWLGSHEGWLLILDNADDIGMARKFIPPGKSGHVLLTTRTRAVGAVARLVEIPEMGTEEGALFLLRRANYVGENAALDLASKADRATALKIATQLDGLPLALDQAAAYIEETDCGLSGYLSLCQTHGPELLELRGALASDHPDPVATTWALSFENIERANTAAAELLRFCAFLSPDGIPEEVFSEGAPELGPVLGAVATDAFALNSAFSEILQYSLLRRDANAGTLEIHRLVQDVLKQAMDKDMQSLWAERAVRAVNRIFPGGEFSTWTVCERLLPQAYACAELIKQWGFEFPEAARLLNDAGFYLRERARHTEAEPLCERALTIREKALGAEHPDVATSLNNLARLYDDQGQYARAEPLCERALAIREKALGPEHPDVAMSLNNLAVLCDNQGQYAKAEPLYQRALAIYQKGLGAEHPDVAMSLNNLALLYDNQGQYAKAEPLYERALAVREKALGAEHPDVADSLNNLALLYDNQGQYAKAEPLYERALAIREKALGAEHPDVADSLNNLAGLYDNQGQYAKAEPLYKRALAIQEKALGTEHPDVAASLNNLAGLYDNQGQYAKAEPLYKRALAIREKALGAEHPDVAASLNNLAVLYDNQGQYEEAEPRYERALAIREKTLGAEHPDVATSLNNLALLYGNQGQYTKAELLYERALAIYEEALGAEHPDVAASLNNLAVLYDNQGQYEKAEPLYKRALAIREKALGAEHPDMATSLHDLARLYDNQGQYAQAGPLYERALAIREKALGAEHLDVAASLNNLAVLYENQGQYGNAEPLYERALAIREKALGAEHPEVAASLNNLAVLHDNQGQYAQAEPLYKRALAIREKALGAEHADVADSLNNLALLYDNQGQYGNAEPLYKRALAIREKALGAEHAEVADSLNNLALLYDNQGQYAKAKPLYERALAIREGALGRTRPFQR